MSASECKTGWVKFSQIRHVTGGLALGLLSVLSACSSDPFSYCSSGTAIASFTLRFGNGLDNFSEDQYSNLRSETEDALSISKAAEASENKDVAKAAKKLHGLIQVFEDKMTDVSWDISTAVLDSSTNEIASQLATAEVLKMANLVESFVINTCGMPSTVNLSEDTGDTLPLPYIPSPTATDPPTNTINENSEDVAIGSTVANLFKLTLSQYEVKCLGNALRGVYDQTSAFAKADEYQAQFQSAFDLCDIQFQVPTES